ncbi:MAG: hypothetical protein R2757_17730 [Draconibacterium sp.]
MESILTKSIITAILTILLVLSGIMLRISGTPYKTSISATHKLSVVATIVFVVLIYKEHFRTICFEGVGWYLFVISSFVFVIAFVTGTLLSFEKAASYKLKIYHRLLSWVTFLFIPAIWLYCH